MFEQAAFSHLSGLLQHLPIMAMDRQQTAAEHWHL